MPRPALLVCAATAALAGCAAPYYQAAPPPPPQPAPLVIIIVGGDYSAGAAVVEAEPEEAIAAEAPAAAPVAVKAPAPVAKVKPSPPPGPVALAPRWRGVWKDQEGHQFAFSLALREERGGRVEGHFDWRLIAAPAGSRLSLHVDETGREQVRGSYDPRSRRLSLSGYQVSNPRLIAVDHYSIVLGPEGDAFQGLSRGGGDAWRSSLSGRLDRLSPAPG